MSRTATHRKIRRTAPVLCTALLAVGLVTVATPANAQDIRRYGPEGEQSGSGSSGGSGSGRSGPYYPGQPRPKQQAGDKSSNRGSGGQGKSKKKKGKSEDWGSYRIRMYQPEQNSGTTRRSGASTTDRTGTAPSSKAGDTESTESADETSSGETSTGKTDNKERKSQYGGVVPGKKDVVDHLKEFQKGKSEKSGPNRLTWLGFRPEKEATRIFVQTSRTVDYSIDVTDAGETVVVTLSGTEFATRNFARTIDTSHFNRTVQSVKAREDGEDITVRIQLDKTEQPDVTQKGSYMYVDFPHRSGEPAKSDGES
ncbi:MAG: AMIN domain-containing protein [Bradymonadaceae bacterium]